MAAGDKGSRNEEYSPRRDQKTEVAILATAHNSSEDQDEWVVAIINLKSRILREFKKRERPWFGTLSRTAKLTIATVK
jgi:hypothetical protein